MIRIVFLEITLELSKSFDRRKSLVLRVKTVDRLADYF
jgi:hypothetical protein